MGSVLRRIRRSGIVIAMAEGVSDDRRNDWRGTTTAGERRELSRKRSNEKRRKRTEARMKRQAAAKEAFRDAYGLDAKMADAAKTLGAIG